MQLQKAYDLLGLRPPSNENEIRRAFKQIALKFHPDRFGTLTQQAWATRKFQQIVAARNLLLEHLHQAPTLLRRTQSPRSPEPLLHPGILEQLAYLLKRLRQSWFENPLWVDTGVIILWLVYGIFRLLVLLLVSLGERLGLDMRCASTSLWARARFLLVTYVVATVHFLGLFWMGSKWHRDDPDLHGWFWAIGYGLLITVFLISESIGFIAAALAPSSLQKERSLVMAENI